MYIQQLQIEPLKPAAKRFRLFSSETVAVNQSIQVSTAFELNLKHRYKFFMSFSNTTHTTHTSVRTLKELVAVIFFLSILAMYRAHRT